MISNDMLTLIGTIAAVVAAIASIAALGFVRLQISITNKQTKLAKTEIEISKTQADIQSKQDAEFRKEPRLWAYSKQYYRRRSEGAYQGDMALRVFNHGDRAASRFRIVIALPPGFVVDSAVWTLIDDFKSRSPILKDYAFYRHDSELAVYPNDYLQFAKFGVRFEASESQRVPAIFWRISTEARQHPPGPGEYYLLTSNSIEREKEALRVHYDESGQLAGTGDGGEKWFRPQR